QFTVKIRWIGEEWHQRERWESFRREHPRKKVGNTHPDGLPLRLWERLLDHVDKRCGVAEATLRETTWAHVSRNQLEALREELLGGEFQVKGKSMNKEELVTCGGIALPEVNFKTMESKLVPGLYFGGECLDIDGVTGGFNFLAAWTAGFLAGNAVG